MTSVAPLRSIRLAEVGELLALRFYTPDEVAELLGHISADTIKELVRTRAITPHRGAKGKVLFDLGDIQELKDFYRPRGVADEEAPEFRTTSRSQSRARSKELRVA